MERVSETEKRAMSDVRSDTGADGEQSPERAVYMSPSEILLSRSRRFCSTCEGENKRKTVWVFAYGETSYFPKLNGGSVKAHGYRTRRCWKCMTDAERKAFREGY